MCGSCLVRMVKRQLKLLGTVSFETRGTAITVGCTRQLLNAAVCEIQHLEHSDIVRGCTEIVVKWVNMH